MSGLIPGVVILVPTGTADYNQTFISEQWDSEADTTFSVTPGVLVSDTDTSLTDLPAGGLWMKAHLDQLSSLPDVTDVEVLRKRTIPGISLVMSTPAIVAGRPMNPKYWANSDSAVTIRTDPGHLDAEANPDPVWNSGTSTWTYPPPDAGVGDIRWTVNSMPDPSGYGGSYPVGTRTSVDGSSALPSQAAQWAADSSTASGPAWKSSYPYKPNMVEYSHHNHDGTIYTVPRALQFNMHYAQHMWMDLGSSGQMQMPFTWIFVAIVLDFHGGIYRHYLLDSGKSPFSYLNSQTEDSVSDDYDIPGTDEGLQYRNYLAIDRNYQYLTNRSGHAIHVKNPQAPKPKMYWGIWNGSFSSFNQSWVGNWSHGVKNTFRGRLDPETNFHRYFLMGRANGHIGIKYSAHLLMFEARVWNRVLTWDELNAQYAQLSTTWKFSQFK